MTRVVRTLYEPTVSYYDSKDRKHVYQAPCTRTWYLRADGQFSIFEDEAVDLEPEEAKHIARKLRDSSDLTDKERIFAEREPESEQQESTAEAWAEV